MISSLAELAEYIEYDADLPEITAYEPALRQELAEYMSRQLFHPSYEIGVDAAVILQHHLEGTEFLPTVSELPNISIPLDANR